MGKRKRENKIFFSFFGWMGKNIVLSEFPHFIIFLDQFHQQSSFQILSPLTIPLTIFPQNFTSTNDHQQSHQQSPNFCAKSHIFLWQVILAISHFPLTKIPYTNYTHGK